MFSSDPFINLFNIYQNMHYEHHGESNSHDKYKVANKSYNLDTCIIKKFIDVLLQNVIKCLLFVFRLYSHAIE